MPSSTYVCISSLASKEKNSGRVRRVANLRIACLREILENEEELLGVIKTELRTIQDKYGTARRSAISEQEGTLSMEDLIPREACLITVTHKGFIMYFRSRRVQPKRGGVC